MRYKLIASITCILCLIVITSCSRSQRSEIYGKWHYQMSDGQHVELWADDSCMAIILESREFVNVYNYEIVQDSVMIYWNEDPGRKITSFVINNKEAEILTVTGDSGKLITLEMISEDVPKVGPELEFREQMEKEFRLRLKSNKE